MEHYSFSSFNIFLPFISLAFALAGIIILLNLQWRVKRHLAKFVRFCLVAFIIFSIRKIMFILGFGNNDWWSTGLQYFDGAMVLFATLAMFELYRVVRLMDGELPKTKA